MCLGEYQLVRDVLLDVLSDYGDGIPVERLVKKVSESMPPGEVLRSGSLRSYLKRALIESEVGGLIERVPDTNPAEYRLPPRGRAGLMDAARCGHVAILERILAEGVGQEAKDAALISGVINNLPGVVRLLLEAGADVHAKDSLFGKDALMYVTSGTSERVVRLLETAANNVMQRTRK